MEVSINKRADIQHIVYRILYTILSYEKLFFDLRGYTIGFTSLII